MERDEILEVLQNAAQSWANHLARHDEINAQNAHPKVHTLQILEIDTAIDELKRIEEHRADRTQHDGWHPREWEIDDGSMAGTDLES